MCFVLEKVNFVILGLTTGSIIAFMFAQFFVDFSNDIENWAFWIILCICSIISTLGCYWKIDHGAIITSIIIGSIVFSLNIGLLIGDFPPIEKRSKLD